MRHFPIPIIFFTIAMNSVIGNLTSDELPNSFLSQRCIIEEDIIALKDFHTYCSQTDLSDQNEKLKLKTFYQNMMILNVTSSSNQTEFSNNKYKCSKWSCLTITPYICDQKFDSCENVSRNDSRLNTKCVLNSFGNLTTCKNILKKVLYKFYYNGSHGITKIDALLVPNNFSYSSRTSKDMEFVQDFLVQFLWSNQKKNYSEVLSGNPGYIIGKPILTGILHNYGNKSHPSWKIQRDSQNFRSNFLTIPENENGNCLSNNDTYLTVEFGYNLLLKCKFHKNHEIDENDLSELASKETRKSTGNSTKKIGMNDLGAFNGTFLCRNIQKILLDMWRCEQKRKIGMFGNAKENNIEDWIPILMKDKKDVLLNRTIGNLSQKDNKLMCSNLIQRVKLSVFYAKIDIQTLSNQNKILSVTYEFDTISNLALVYKNGTVAISTDLENEVLFYDISFPKKKKIVEPPSLNIKLPYDFFYPFVKVDNGTNSVQTLNFIIYAVLFMLLRGSNKAL